MSLLKALKVSRVKRPSVSVTAGHDPMERARRKMLAAVALQNRLVGAEQTGKELKINDRKPRKWYFQVNGTYYVAVKYGSKSLPIARNLNTIEAGPTLASVRKVLATLKAAVEAGELDKQLMKAVASMGRRKKTT